MESIYSLLKSKVLHILLLFITLIDKFDIWIILVLINMLLFISAHDLIIKRCEFIKSGGRVIQEEALINNNENNEITNVEETDNNQ